MQTSRRYFPLATSGALWIVGGLLPQVGCGAAEAHGPLSDKAALTTYRDMLVTARDSVQLKADGRSLQEMLAAKLTADLDETWGKGFMMPDAFPDDRLQHALIVRH